MHKVNKSFQLNTLIVKFSKFKKKNYLSSFPGSVRSVCPRNGIFHKQWVLFFPLFKLYIVGNYWKPNVSQLNPQKNKHKIWKP